MADTPATPAPITDDAAEHLVDSYGAGGAGDPSSTAGASGTERQHVARLALALDHLRSFKQTFNPEDEVDEESGLTGDDLAVIVEVLEALHGMAAKAPPESAGSVGDTLGELT